MVDYKLTREEQETIIKGNAASKEWEIVTADPRTIRRMQKQGFRPDDRANPWGYASYTVPLDKIAIRKAQKRKTGFALNATKKPTALHKGASFANQKPKTAAL